MQPSLERYAARLLGDYTLVEDRRQPGGSRILEVRDPRGDRWFAKQADSIALWRSETRAYREWVPALRGRAPALRAASRAHRALLLSAVPGVPAGSLDKSVHRQAGGLLRTLHQAGVPEPASRRHLTATAQRLQQWLHRHSSLFSAAELRFVREQTGLLRRLPPMPQVPCHGDFRPYNWLRDDAGTVRVIDFGAARLHVWLFDLTRLYLGPWWDAPRLAAAFLSGYGRQLNEHDRDFVRLSAPSQLVVSIAWSRVHRAPELERRSRDRLAQLIQGHPVVLPQPTRWELVRRRVAATSAEGRAGRALVRR